MKPFETQIPPWVSEESIKHLTGLREGKIRCLKEAGTWVKGLHFNYINPSYPRKGVIYNSALCLDWVNNIETPEIHEQAIELWRHRNKSHSLVRQACSLYVVHGFDVCNENKKASPWPKGEAD